MNYILGAPSVFKGLDSKSYAKVPYMVTAATRPIRKGFKNLDIRKYDKNSDH